MTKIQTATRIVAIADPENAEKSCRSWQKAFAQILFALIWYSPHTEVPEFSTCPSDLSFK